MTLKKKTVCVCDDDDSTFSVFTPKTRFFCLGGRHSADESKRMKVSVVPFELEEAQLYLQVKE